MNARDRQPGEPTQHIHLVLGNTANSTRIKDIEVSVYGTSGQNRAVPTLTAKNHPWDAQKRLEIKVNIDEDQEASTDLTLRGFTSVQSITLESVTYADGSIWNAFGRQSCRIAPDPFMLVGSRQ